MDNLTIPPRDEKENSDASHTADKNKSQNDGLEQKLSQKNRFLDRFWPKTLLGRSLLIVVVPLVFLQIGATWIFYDRLYSRLTDQLVENVVGEIGLVSDMLAANTSPTQIQQITDYAQKHFSLALTYEENALLSASPKTRLTKGLQDNLDSALRAHLSYHFSVDPVTPNRDIEVEVQIGEDVARIYIPHNKLFRPTAIIFVLWTFFSSVFLFIVILLFMKSQVKPIKRLAHAAKRLGRGIDVYNFKPEGAKEVRQAAMAFLQMQARIQRQIQQRTTILAGVSHDLRTPLTRMKLELAMLGDSPEVKNLQEDVDQLQHMIDDYLTFARGEGGEQPKQTNIAALLHQVSIEARRNGANLELRLEQSLPLLVRRDALRRCLVNIINNAQRYGGDIFITARRRRKGIEIMIEDNGIGIAEEKLEEVFRPFYRIEESRNQETGGTGLGLTIARDVVRGHGGELTLSRSPMGGLRARIWLPR